MASIYQTFPVSIRYPPKRLGVSQPPCQYVHHTACVCYGSRMQARLRISEAELARERERRPAFPRRLDRQPFQLVERQQPPKPPASEQHRRPLLTPMEAILQDEVWSPPGRRRPPKRVSPVTPQSAVESESETEIDALYREARRLIPLAETDPRAEAAYQQTMRRLRELQESEAERWVARFRERCELPPGAGYAALKRADELIAKYAHLAPANRTTEDADRATSPTEPSE